MPVKIIYRDKQWELHERWRVRDVTEMMRRKAWPTPTGHRTFPSGLVYC